MSPRVRAVALDEWVDPQVLFLGGPAGHRWSFWLDAGPDARDGWSFLGLGRPEPDSQRLRDLPAGRSGHDPQTPVPFTGGWVGWLGYDAGAARAGAPSRPDRGGEERWLAVSELVAVDHARRRVWAVTTPDRLDAFVTRVRSWAAAGASLPDDLGEVAPVAVEARHTPDAYARLIERCRAAIREGDAYQLCLTTRFETHAAVDPVAAFLRLRTLTPAHHGGIIHAGDVSLVSASPERFLEIGDGVVRTRPIKGTRPRGADDDADAAAAADLAGSAKERAENVMIVDLMRNDLARVCDPGTVTVERLLEIESYAAVHQLVSTVAGRLHADATLGDILDAAFPAGSMTGAPKLSAMTILHELERHPRGVFAGCFGWVGADGSADLAMVIRSIVTHPGGAYVGAGGGITWSSIPRDEVAEVAVKARGPLAALGATLPAEWVRQGVV